MVLRARIDHPSRIPHSGLGLRLILLVLFALLLAFVAACSEEDEAPAAEVLASVTRGQAPLKVSFINGSRHADQFPWDFGDGTSASTSRVREPMTHEYTKAGAYLVTLTAIKKGDPQETSVATVTITVESGSLDHVTLEPSTLSIGVTESRSFKATALDRFDNPIPDLTYTFRTDERAGEVDRHGSFTARTSAGTYENGVTVEVSQKSITRTAAVPVTVEPGSLDHVIIEPTSPTIGAAKVRRFSAMGLDRHDNPIPGLIYGFRADERAGRFDGQGMFRAGTRAGNYMNAATVEVTQGHVTRVATTDVAIMPGPLDRVQIEPTAITMEVTKERRFTAKAFDQFDNLIPNAGYVFQVNDRAGRMDGDGRFTAGVKAGTYNGGVSVEVSHGGAMKTATAEITVVPGPLHHIDIRPSAAKVEVSNTVHLNPTALDRFDNPVPGGTIVFRADGQVGRVDVEGRFTAGTRAGTYDAGVLVEITRGGITKTAAVDITLEPGPLDHINIRPDAPTIEVGKSLWFSATGLDRFGNTIPDLRYVFQPGGRAGRVDGDGRFTAGAMAGTYDTAVRVETTQGTVTADATARITVKHGPLDRVLISPAAVTLSIGQSLQFTARAVDAYGNHIRQARITWDPFDGAGTFTSDGLLTASTVAGRFERGVKATAVLGLVPKEATASLTVNPDPLDTISVVPFEVEATATHQLEYIATDRYGNVLSGIEITWAMLDQNAGTITPSGLLTAGEVARSFAGTVQARATQGEVTLVSVAPVTVIPGQLEQLFIGPDHVAIGIKMNQQFVAVGVDRYGNRIPGLTSSWTLEEGGGTVTPDGLFVAGTNHGSYMDTIKATVTQGEVTRSATASVTVEPDRILFNSDRSKGQIDMYMMNSDGTNVERLTSTAATESLYSWSPEGRRIVYNLRSQDGGIFVMNDDSTWPIRLIQNDQDVSYIWPAWSPDGDKIVFSRFVLEPELTIDIYVMDVDGGNVRALTNTPSAGNLVPAWSPDGTKIAFASDRDGNQEIYVMGSDGGGQTRLTGSPASDSSPAWSPDGTEIVFHSNRDGGFKIYVMDADGSNVRQLTTDSGFDDRVPSWSPDGSRIIFHSNRDGNNEIYVMNRDGGSQSRLTISLGQDEDPRWAPRKLGVDVGDLSVIIADASNLRAMTAEEVISNVRGSVVRIVTERGLGSGFVIDAGGLILTKNHLVNGAESISVLLDDGTAYPGIVLGRDLVRDLAVLRIDASQLTALELGEVSHMVQGQLVVALGFELAVEEIADTGDLVSTMVYDVGRNIIWIRTDSPVDPENVGGPLVNLQGQVIGVLGAGFDGANVESAGHAISSNTVKLYLKRMVSGEVITS